MRWNPQCWTNSRFCGRARRCRRTIAAVGLRLPAPIAAGASENPQGASADRPERQAKSPQAMRSPAFFSTFFSRLFYPAFPAGTISDCRFSTPFSMTFPQATPCRRDCRTDIRWRRSATESGRRAISCSCAAESPRKRRCSRRILRHGWRYAPRRRCRWRRSDRSCSCGDAF